jgi:hypothetical protein
LTLWPCGPQVSDDGGATFGPIREHEDLLTPVCQGSVLFVQGSTVLYAGPRQPRASLSLSADIRMSVLNNSCDRMYI